MHQSYHFETKIQKISRGEAQPLPRPPVGKGHTPSLHPSASALWPCHVQIASDAIGRNHRNACSTYDSHESQTQRQPDRQLIVAISSGVIFVRKLGSAPKSNHGRNFRRWKYEGYAYPYFLKVGPLLEAAFVHRNL